jgi:hypothetical protein
MAKAIQLVLGWLAVGCWLLNAPGLAGHGQFLQARPAAAGIAIAGCLRVRCATGLAIGFAYEIRVTVYEHAQQPVGINL